MEALPWAWVVASNPRRIGLNFASKESFKIGHVLRAIDHDRPRSSVDRAPDSSKVLLDNRGIDSTTNGV